MKVSYPTDDKINIEHPFGTSLQKGFYPIGFYHCWHGGVHIEGKGKKIKAIADGKIIAFRYNNKEIEVGKKYGKPITLSNNFVLIRHNYKSGDNAMTFYSLYYHLFFGEKAVEEEKAIPSQQEDQKDKKYRAVPKVESGYKLSGVWSIDQKVFFPTHTTLTIKEDKGNYYVVDGQDINNVPQTDMHIPKTYTNSKNEEKTTVQNNKVLWTGIAYQEQKGTLLYYAIGGDDKVARKVITSKDTFTVRDNTNENWIEINIGNGKESCFLKKGELKNGELQEVENVKKKTPSDTNKNSNLPSFLQNQELKEGVQICDISVKAGELIGYVGKQGIYNLPDYYAAHLEVFTPEDFSAGDINAFIENKKNGKTIDGEKQNFYFEVKEGVTLNQHLKIDFVSPIYYKGIEVKLLTETEKYVQISPLESPQEIKPEELLPTSFIEKGKHFWNRFLGSAERETFWIERSLIEQVIKEKRKIWVLKSSISHIFLTNPEEEYKKRDPRLTYENELSKNITVDIRPFQKSAITFRDSKWLFIESHYYKGSEKIHNQGWVSYPKEEELFSAYCWNRFGFRVQDAETHRMYPIKNVNHYEGTSDFIKTIIRLIDKNGNRNIENEELQARYNSPGTYHILSKMVCKHQSEWSYSWERIESDAQAFYKYISEEK